MSAFDALTKWLQDPKIRIEYATPDDVAELQTENQGLRDEITKLRYLYAQECNINMRLVDVLSSHGINWR